MNPQIHGHSLSGTAPSFCSSCCRRMVRLLHHPIAAVFSRCLTDFYSPAHGTIERIPEVRSGCVVDVAETHMLTGAGLSC